MDIINGGNQGKVAGATVGDEILIHLVNGKVEKGLLAEIKRNGIESFQVDIRNRPLTFYPFTAIIKITKYTQLE